MTKHTPILTIAIVGAGLGGLATSIGLRRAGHDVTVFEKAPELGEIGAGIQVPPNATRIFHEWGLLEALEALAEEPQIGIMRSYRDGEVLSSVPMSQQYRGKFGAPYLMVHRVDLHRLLAKEARKQGVLVRSGAEVVGVDTSRTSSAFASSLDQSQNHTQTERHAHIHLASGSHIPFDLILGADGERSICRPALQDHNHNHSTPWTDSGDHVFRITIPTSSILSADDKDLSALVSPPAINLWIGPRGNACTYNLHRDGMFNVVLTQAHTPQSLSLSLSAAEFVPRPVAIADVAGEFRGWDPLFHRVLELAMATGSACARWTLLEREFAERWVSEDGFCGLLGDAAHAMLPFLGQGAAMAFEDAAVLSVLFASITDRKQIPELLMIYERIRKPRLVEMSRRAKSNQRVYGLEDGPEQQERDRQLREQGPFDGSPNFLADPVYQEWAFGYNAFEEAERAVRESAGV